VNPRNHSSETTEWPGKTPYVSDTNFDVREMTSAERQAFLAHGTRTAKLATVRLDGRPHAAPVWFVTDGDDLIFMTWHASIKGKAIQRDPRVALVIDDESYPYAFVLVEGTASLASDSANRRCWARLIASRYVPADVVERYADRNATEGELVARVKADRWIARACVAE
jgi:PPOX class probable F420-dependent enzyme